MKVKIEYTGVWKESREWDTSGRPVAEVAAELNTKKGEFRVKSSRWFTTTGWFVEECNEDCVAFDTRMSGEDVVKELRYIASMTIENGMAVRCTVTKGKRTAVIADVTPENVATAQAALVEYEAAKDALRSTSNITDEEHMLVRTSNSLAELVKLGHESLADAVTYTKDAVATMVTARQAAQEAANEREKAAALKLAGVGYNATSTAYALLG